MFLVQFLVLFSPEDTIVQTKQAVIAAMIVMIVPMTGLNLKHAAKISSFEKNPEKGGIPEIARQAIRNVQWVIGIYLRSPPIVDISLLCTAWMMQPAPKNNRALNMACVNKWNILAM